MKKVFACFLLLPLVTFGQVKDSLAISIEMRKTILTETKKGGKLDFFTPIKGKEYQGVRLKSGQISTNLGMALYQWGRAVADSGVNNVEEALSIFKEFKGRPLNPRDSAYIKMGVLKELD